jgi:hypothetical protein
MRAGRTAATSPDSQALIRRLAPDQLAGREECERAAVAARWRYDGRVCFETGESRSASGGKLPF